MLQDDTARFRTTVPGGCTVDSSEYFAFYSKIVCVKVGSNVLWSEVEYCALYGVCGIC